MPARHQVAEIGAPAADRLGLLTTDQFIDELHERLSGARRRIAIQLMTFDGDDAGLHVSRRLIEAARRGVAVCLLIDSFALRFVSDVPVGRPEVQDEFASTLDMYTRLRRAGVDLRFTNDNGPGNLFALARNHKKLYLIDDVAYLGGINVSDHNFEWHDFMVRVEGAELVRLLRTDFNATVDGRFTSMDRTIGSSRVVTNRELARTFDRLVSCARQRVVVASPYALDRRLARSLEASTAPERTVVVAERNNFRFLEAITPYLAARASRAGIALRTYSRFSHSKFLLADDLLLIGSSNFGRHSLTCNQEIGLIVSDRSFVADFESAFLTGLQPVELSSARSRRVLGWLGTAAMEAYLIAYARLIAPRVKLVLPPGRRHPDVLLDRAA